MQAHQVIPREWHEAVAAAYRAGATMPELAGDWGVSIVRIMQILDGCGVRRRPKGPSRGPIFHVVYWRAVGVSTGRIAAICGVTRPRIRARIEQLGCDRPADLLALSHTQLAAYRDAVDGKAMHNHLDALDIALKHTRADTWRNAE